jgi:hypothetical protein
MNCQICGLDIIVKGATVAAPPAPVKVGDMLHHFDQNRRYYTKPPAGGQFGELIYAEHFTAHRIIGESKGAWIVDNSYGGTAKVGKRLVGGSIWFTDAGKADNIWRNEHRHKVRDLVDHADAAQLRAVAHVLGYVADGY